MIIPKYNKEPNTIILIRLFLSSFFKQKPKSNNYKCYSKYYS